MEVRAAGDPKGVWGDPAAGTYIIPQGIPPVPCPHGAVPVSQQPVVILQQLPGTLAQPTRAPHLREGGDEQSGCVGIDVLRVRTISSCCPATHGAFADRRGRGGHGFPPPLRPLRQSHSHLGMASPGWGWGTGGHALPGHGSGGRGARSATSSTPQCHRDRRSQCPTIIRVLRHAGAAAVSSLHPEVASPARPWPPPQKILCVPRVGALWY
ncbi:proline-rich protein 29 isoform X2 [Anser cygnoides]|uniref:proline-rich protein 29 isoform X2 n=1 Tax=Anser cygnoides TaxID=8845 RepID=UPI0034D1B1F1